ncbi:MAG: choice-of-anchor Q domain-containing protein, partial [Anaerolineae bacterium]
ISGNHLTGNYLGDGGGGLYNGSGEAALTNCTISGNGVSAGDPAGGIYSAGTLKLTNCTVVGNSGQQSGGLDGQATLKNTIVANNTAHSGSGDCGSNATIISQGYNLDSDGSCHLTSPSDLSNTDPKLGPLQNNGGPTFTYALLPGSPAIDAIDPSICPPPDTDQRGEPRPGKGSARCDIGAFEFQGISDGTVGSGGGTVTDTAGTGAALSVGAGILAQTMNVFIEVTPAPSVSLPPGFVGLGTAFVDITLDPTPSAPLPAPGASITLPLSGTLIAGTPLILFKYDPTTSTLVDTGKVGLVDVSGRTATFKGVTSFSTFVGVSGVKSINNRLLLVQLKLSYNPKPITNAPAGVFTFSSTYKNKTSTTLKDLFFKVKTLSGNNLLLNADGGPGGVGAVISVPAVALGDSGTLEPNESFKIDFKIGLKKRWPFLFLVNAYGVPLGQVAGVTTMEEDSTGFQFEVKEEQFQVDGDHIILYLPLIMK